MREQLADALRARCDDAEEWCAEKADGGALAWGVPRALLLAYLIYGGVRHLADPLYRTWFAGITLAVHEIGHVVCSGLGRTMHILGGSLFQLLIPTIAALYLLLRQRDYFGFAVGGAWLSFALWELATYIGDASHEDLPLVGFGANPDHDWSTLLTMWHLLNHDAAIAAATRVLAFLTWGLAVAFGGWLCFRVWRLAPRR